MTSPLVWKSLDIYADIYQRFYKNPLQWDKEKKKIVLTTKTKDLIFYYFIIFVILATLCLAALIVLFYKENNLPAFVIMLHVLLIIWLIFCIILHLFIITKGYETADGWNKAIEMEMLLRKSITGNIEGPKDDIVGLALIGFVYLVVTLSVFFCVAGVYMNLDPLYLIIKLYIPPKTSNRIEIKALVSFTRFVILPIGGFEMLRPGPILVTFLVILTRIVNESILLIKKGDEFRKFIKYYNIVNVWHCVIPEISNFAMMVLLGCFSVLSVTLNFGSLRGYGLIPLPLYLIFPSGEIVVYFLVWYVLTMIIKIYEDTENQLNDWKYREVLRYRRSRARKYIQLKVGAVHPLGHEVGVNGFKLFKIKKSTRTTYYDMITNFTVSLLLSVSVE